MTLPLLVTKDMWQEFDDAWAELRSSGGPIDELLPALKLAGEKKRAGRLVPQAREHADALVGAGRAADAALILGATLVAGGNPGEINQDLVKASDAAWSDEEWYPIYREVTGFVEGASDLRKPWKKFAKLIAFTEGSALFHPGGWGAGRVTETSAKDNFIKVKFWNGRQDEFPLTAAMDIFDPLPETDLRARSLEDPDALRKEVKANPLEALSAILVRHNGRATTTTIKTAMMQIGIEGSAWSAWWRKARKLAENSDDVEVSGTPQKSFVTQLLVKKDPGEALRRILQRSTNLAEVTHACAISSWAPGSRRPSRPSPSRSSRTPPPRDRAAARATGGLAPAARQDRRLAEAHAPGPLRGHAGPEPPDPPSRPRSGSSSRPSPAPRTRSARWSCSPNSSAPAARSWRSRPSTPSSRRPTPRSPRSKARR